MTQLESATGEDQAMPRLDLLPDEVLQAIFQHLDAISLTAISLSAKRFLSVADEHLIWKTLCLRDFTHWDTSHDIESRTADSSFHEWKGLYAVRYRAHVATENTLRGILDESVGRLARVQQICNHGYGIKDTLLQLYQEASTTEAPLAQRYWTYTLLSCLNRSQALEIWTKIRYRSDIENPTELALAALDMFTIGSSTVGDVDDTFRRLHSYVSAVRSAHPDIDIQSPRTKAIKIAAFLREKSWIGIEEGAEYYSIENQFLGYALRSRHRNSLPLITCVIYSYVCRAFGLKAQPCSYPNHVHVVVQPTDPERDLDGNFLPENHSQPSDTSSNANQANQGPSELTHLYMDPFNTHHPIPLSTLSTQLTFIVPAATAQQRNTYLLPANARSLLLRTAHNVLRSINTVLPPARGPPHFVATNPTTTISNTNSTSNDPSDNSPEDPPPNQIHINDAAYAALFILVLFPSTPASLASNLSELRQHFAGNYPEDLRNYITYIAPLTTGLGNFGGRSDPLVKLFREEDANAKKPKLREEIQGGENVRYRVGTVFRHRRQGYTGVVYGWDAKCEMGERWIMGNSVDSLAEGRGQAFYNSFVDDRSSRYVAQENIIPLGPEEFGEQDVDQVFSVEIGKWFRSFDKETGMFVSNVVDEYPED